MKLFNTIFDLLVNKGEKLLFGDDQIYAIKSENKIFYYHNFECYENGYCKEQHYPTKTEIEEWLTWIIQRNDPRVAKLIEFLNANTPDEARILSVESLQEEMKKEYPDIVQRVETVSEEDMVNAAMELVIKAVKKGGEGLGRGDKETYENLKFKNGVFIYEGGDVLCSEPEFSEKFETEDAFKEFMIKNRWVVIKNGMVTGRGNPTSYISFWLEAEGVGSLREYIAKHLVNR